MKACVLTGRLRRALVAKAQILFSFSSAQSHSIKI
jgi:hypothetical protein